MKNEREWKIGGFFSATKLKVSIVDFMASFGKVAFLFYSYII